MPFHSLQRLRNTTTQHPHPRNLAPPPYPAIPTPKSPVSLATPVTPLPLPPFSHPLTWTLCRPWPRPPSPHATQVVGMPALLPLYEQRLATSLHHAKQTSA